MLSLLLSHWPLNRRLLIGLLPILLLWFFVALHPGGDSEELRFLFIALATSATLLALAVLQSPEAFLVALPVRRNDLVRATYVAGLLAALLGLALPLAARWVVTGGSLPAGVLGDLKVQVQRKQAEIARKAAALEGLVVQLQREGIPTEHSLAPDVSWMVDDMTALMQREGVRMGLWGAAQAVAFGLGGILGTAASDLPRTFWL